MKLRLESADGRSETREGALDDGRLDFTWEWTWTFTAASSDESPYHFKFVASRDSWPPPLIFSGTSATTLAGQLIDEQSANQGSLPDIRITVEAASYRFTFHEDTLRYEIVKL